MVIVLAFTPAWESKYSPLILELLFVVGTTFCCRNYFYVSSNSYTMLLHHILDYYVQRFWNSRKTLNYELPINTMADKCEAN